MDVYFEFSKQSEMRRLLFSINENISSEKIQFLMKIIDYDRELDVSRFFLLFSPSHSQNVVNLYPSIRQLLSGNVTLRISVLK